MSQFYWQNILQNTTGTGNQYGTSSHERSNNDAANGDSWSYVGLNNENVNERSQQQQQQQRQRSYWWSQHNESATDPYSAAVFGGFNASSGNVATSNWQSSTTVTPYNFSARLSEQQSERTVTPAAEERNASPKVDPAQEIEQQRHVFGIHQPVLDSYHTVSGRVPSALAVTDEKDSGRRDDENVQRTSDTHLGEGNEQTNTAPAPTSEKDPQANANEPESGLPTVTVAVAQVTPMIAISLASTTAVETPPAHSAGIQSYNPQVTVALAATTAAAPAAANVARVGPISNQQNDLTGFSVNRVTPTLQPPMFSNSHSAPVVPVTNSAHGTPVSSLPAEETVEAPITVTNVVSELPATTNAITNSQQQDAAPSPVAKHESVINSASINSKELIKKSSVSPPTPITSSRGAREPKLKREEKEHSTPILSSAEQSTDSAAVDDSSISERPPGKKYKDSKNVRDRYRIIRQQYPEVVKRLDRLRMETHSLDWRSVQSGGSLDIGESSHPSIPNSTQRNPTPAIGVDPNIPANVKNIEPMIFDFRPPSKMNHSFTVPERINSDESSVKNDICYGEDFVNSLRRNRHARTREHDYFPSRGTKSEMGEIGPYRGPALALHRQYMMQHAYGYNSAAGYHPSREFYPSGRQSLGPYLGRRTAYELAMYSDENALPRRPQSSFDASAYAKYQHSNEFAPDSHQKDEMEEHLSENEDESSGSDSEIARIHYEQEMTRRAAAMRYNAMPVTAPNEFYYFGVIQLPQERVEHVMRRMPPPPEYFQLPPIEKAAYIFYCVLYQHHYQPVDLFHKKFNREYFSYMCEGDSAEIALWKICKHTQEEFIAKRSAKKLRAYEMSQKQLFSDDRETLDSRDLVMSPRPPTFVPYKRSKSEPLQSEHGSRCDAEDESDRLSVDSAREPLKFRVAHSFVRFGVGGKGIVLNVQNSENILEIRDLKSLISDRNVQRISNAIESFRGPLIAGFTPTHSVRLYVQRQIEAILKSEVYRSNPSNGAAGDCLLIWQLLEMLVQQQGRVTGPDLSRLLMTGCHVTEHRRHAKEKSTSFSPTVFNEHSGDPKAYDRYTQLLLGGHIKEAIESAMKDGLYSDAMILARRICATEPQELEKIEAAFLSHRSEMNPIMTLLTVANGQPAPVLTSPPQDEANSWRSHAAIVLANLNTPAALGTVYQLGRVLARRELYAAADFCFLAVSLLTPSYNPFQPVPKSEDEYADVPQHITLIHATLADDDEMNFECPNGFSIIDLHATEIFEYATKLANDRIAMYLSGTIAYQLCRLDYAEMVSEFGSSATDAFRYCVEIARGVWERCGEIEVEKLERLYELAERLKFVASADANSTAWLPVLRSMIDERKKVVEEKQCDIKGTAANISDMPEDAEDVGLKMVAKVSPKGEAAEDMKSIQDQKNIVKTTALDSEAVEWHIGHQEPITIASAAVNRKQQQQEVEFQKSENNEYRMQPGQLHERVRTNSGSTNVSVHTSQHSTVPPNPPISIKDSPESAGTTTPTTVTSSTLPQASERISHSAIRGYYDDASYQQHSDLVKEHRSDLKDRDFDVRTEVTTTITDGNSTGTSSHESTPRRNVDRSERKMSAGMTSFMLTENQSTGMLQRSRNLPPVPKHSDAVQSQNYASERSRQQQQSNTVKKDEKASKGKNTNDHRQNSGIFSKLKATIAKAIPSSNEMILPDDKNPSIVWDPKLNRYVGEGIEEEPVHEPPPSTTSSVKLNGLTHGSVGGLSAARLGGGSRYSNPLIQTAPSKPVLDAAPLIPSVPTPATFGFIPTMPDDGDASSGDSPFSVDTGPQQPTGAEVVE